MLPVCGHKVIDLRGVCLKERGNYESIRYWSLDGWTVEF